MDWMDIMDRITYLNVEFSINILSYIFSKLNQKSFNLTYLCSRTTHNRYCVCASISLLAEVQLQSFDEMF